MQHPLWDFFTGKANLTEALPVGVVLTIPGSGSEASGECVITRSADSRKLALRTDSILKPRFAIVNPEMTATLTARQTARGIMDMMAHIFESYFSPTTRVEMTDRLAEGLLMGLIAEAPRVLADPSDYRGRANLEWAATLAHNGLCSCGRREDLAPVLMAHEICALYPEVAFGEALAVVLPAWMAFMAHHKPSKVAQLGRRIFAVDERDDRTAAIETVAHIKAFFQAVLRMPVNFKELGIDNPDIPAISERLHAGAGEVVGAYYKLTDKDTRRIYELMLDDEQRSRQMQAASDSTEIPTAG